MKDQQSTPEKIRAGERPSRLLQVLVLSSFLLGTSIGQTTSALADEARQETTRKFLIGLRQGTFGPVTQEQLASAETGQLVSILKERFAGSQASDIKGRAAWALMKLGEKDAPYWDYLVSEATSAIESDAPSPRCLSSANCVSGHPPEYVAWARSHHVTEGSEAQSALDWLEGKVSLIAEDPRAIPLLRQALKSPYIWIVETAAKGLARLHDRDSIPLIVAACKRFGTREEIRGISSDLRFFERDPEARAAADAGEEECLPPPNAIEALIRNDEDSILYVRKAAATHPVETVAILKENFITTQDERNKAQIASSLIGLGAKEAVYWDFLVQRTVAALEGGPSSVAKYDVQGKLIEVSTSEEEGAEQNAIFNTVMLFVETVAETPDPRGIKILRKALSSPKPEIQSLAAAGLVRARDNDSIPLILDLCKTSSPDVAQSIASQVLVYFDDPRAQSAVDRYLSKDDAKLARNEKANGIGPLGPWPPK